MTWHGARGRTILTARKGRIETDSLFNDFYPHQTAIPSPSEALLLRQKFSNSTLALGLGGGRAKNVNITYALTKKKSTRSEGAPISEWIDPERYNGKFSREFPGAALRSPNWRSYDATH